jgi:hypothetical protein
VLVLLTAWSRGLAEKLTGPQLVNKFPAVYGTRRFVTVFTRARHLSLSWARPSKSMLLLHSTSLRSIWILSSRLHFPVPRLLCLVRNRLRFFFYGEELLALRPNPKLEDHPLSDVRDCAFSIFVSILHLCRPYLHPQPEDAPCRGDRDPLITVTGTHLSRLQGPTYHDERDPLITVTWTHVSRWQGPTYHGDRDPLVTVTGTHLHRCDIESMTSPPSYVRCQWITYIHCQS